MRWLADENFPLASYRLLLESDWDIIHIGITNPSITDDEVIEQSIEEQRVIVTFDSDFGELVFKFGLRPIGVIYFRWAEFTPDYPGKYLLELFDNNSLEIIGYFTVIDENQIRQRKI